MNKNATLLPVLGFLLCGAVKPAPLPSRQAASAAVIAAMQWRTLHRTCTFGFYAKHGTGGLCKPRQPVRIELRSFKCRSNNDSIDSYSKAICGMRGTLRFSDGTAEPFRIKGAHFRIHRNGKEWVFQGPFVSHAGASPR